MGAPDMLADSWIRHPTASFSVQDKIEMQIQQVVEAFSAEHTGVADFSVNYFNLADLQRGFKANGLSFGYIDTVNNW